MTARSNTAKSATLRLVGGVGGDDRPTRLGEIQPELPTWLWPDYVPRRALTMVFGPEGSYKSTLAAHLAAKVTSEGGVVWVNDLESDLGSVARPRYDVAGAHSRRCHLTRDFGLRLPDGMARLERMATRLKRLDLLVLDTLSNHMPWATPRAGLALEPLLRFASDADIGIEPRLRPRARKHAPVRSIVSHARDCSQRAECMY